MRKWTITILAGLFLVLSALVASAQEATPEAVFCGDLAQADCDLLRQSSEAMHNLTSATFDFDFQITFAEGEDEPQTLAVAGTGSFAHLPAGMRESVTQPAEMFRVMNQLLAEFQGDLSLTVTLPPRLREAMAEKAGGDLPETFTLQLRMVDGIGYLNAGALQPFLARMTAEEIPAMFRGWVGVNVGQLLTRVVSKNPEILEDIQVFGIDRQTAGIMGDPTVFESAVNLERSADADGLAVFTVTLDFAALGSDPAFIDLIRSEIEDSGHELTDAQLERGLRMMARAGESVVFRSTQTIDPATGYLRKMSFDLSVDGSMLPRMGEAGVVSEDSPVPTFTLSVSVSLDDFDSAPAVTAPEDATILPPALLERMGAGMMRGDFGRSSSGHKAEATPEATPES